MRTKLTGSLLFLLLSLIVVGAVGAQSPSVEWASWNAQITAHTGSAPLDIAETQNINVVGGPLRAGQRNFSQPVNIQAVYLAMNGGQPQQLSQGTSAGMYQVTQSNGDMVVQYQLPQPAQTGDSFVVQINYTVAPPASGLIDWFAVPGSHPGPVNSSKVTINFPDGQAPNVDFARVPQGNANVTASGNSIIIQSQGVIPANQPFEIQVPYGANVGAPANSGSGNTSPVQSQPIGTTPDTGGGIGVLGIIVIVIILVVLGGGGLLRGLLGGLLGGGLSGGSGGGIFGGGGGSSGGGIFGGGRSSGGTSSGGRGFRQSSNQNRQVPTINNDKEQGGGASFK